jgi:hypothetical protein
MPNQSRNTLDQNEASHEIRVAWHQGAPLANQIHVILGVGTAGTANIPPVAVYTVQSGVPQKHPKHSVKNNPSHQTER